MGLANPVRPLAGELRYHPFFAGENNQASPELSQSLVACLLRSIDGRRCAWSSGPAWNEADRLAVLHRYRVLGTPPEPRVRAVSLLLV